MSLTQMRGTAHGSSYLWTGQVHTGTWPLQKRKREVPNLIPYNGMRESLGESGVNTQKHMVGSDQAPGLVEEPGWRSHGTTSTGSGFQESTPLPGGGGFLERLHSYSGHL